MIADRSTWDEEYLRVVEPFTNVAARREDETFLVIGHGREPTKTPLSWSRICRAAAL